MRSIAAGELGRYLCKKQEKEKSRGDPSVANLRIEINEAGKGNHRHWGAEESEYNFSGVEKLLADFQGGIERWNDENGNS